MKEIIKKYKCDFCKDEIDKNELLENKTGGGMNYNFLTSDKRSGDVAYKGFGFFHFMTRKLFLGKIVFGSYETIDICINCFNEIDKIINKLTTPTKHET